MTRSSSIALLGLCFLAACAAPSSEDDPAATGSDTKDVTEDGSATIAFARGFTENVQGALYEGEGVKVTYDPDRITSCRAGDGDPHHGPTFDYTLHYRFFANAGFTSVVVANANGARPVTLTVPFGAEELTIYFDHTNPRGCQAFDSANGANYHFPVRRARMPVVHFRADKSVATDGDLVAGKPVLVDWAPSRLPNCINSGRKVRVFGRLDGRDLEGREISVGEGARTAVARIDTEAGAKELSLWFQAIDFRGCVEWDSNDGKNFSFALR